MAPVTVTEFPARTLNWMLRRPVRQWVGPVVVTLIAGFLRFFRLGTPRELVFDETYYVKQGFSLLTLGYEGNWADGADDAFASGDFFDLEREADYVVHPPLGKWLIAIGLRIFGAESSFGWRFTAALLGTLTVFLVAWVGTRLLRSSIYGSAAGLLLAVDGLHLVQSRTSILDIFLTFFVFAAFAALLMDRAYRRRYSTRFRPWLIAAGVLAGMACAVKWSGTYYVAACGILAVIWDCSLRYSRGEKRWLAKGLIKDGVLAFIQFVPTAVLTYVAGWWSWFTHSGAYLRNWAADNPGEGVSWLPESLRSLWEYHTRMWEFHTTLTSHHDYASPAWEWLLMLRPTSYFYDSEVSCGADECSQAVTSLGNPVLWWGGIVALIICFVWWLWWNDGRAGMLLMGVAAGLLPWLMHGSRTVFMFYAVVFAPFLALAISYAVSLLRESPPGLAARAQISRRVQGHTVLAAVCAVAVALAVFFYPVWTAQEIPYDAWRMRMWFSNWI